MAELEKDVTTFREQGKLNAANRLENQLAVVKVVSVRICHLFWHYVGYYNADFNTAAFKCACLLYIEL